MEGSQSPSPSFEALENLFSRSARQVEDAMRDWVEARDLPDCLRDAALYVLMAGGKRLRPLLILESCRALGGSESSGMNAAMAMEMIHTFSLVHDDLPCMDNADMRRGKPTLHVRDSEVMAVLAGDLLMGLAFECLSEVPDKALAASLTSDLSRAANAMIVGQVYDTIEGSGDDLTGRPKLERIHRLKTGALIRASTQMGARCAGAGDDAVARQGEYGEIIGLMFQVVDDWLDATQTTEHLGKNAGLDAENNKITYVDLLGLEGCREEIERLRTRAHDVLAPLGEAGANLGSLCDWIAMRTK